MVIGGGTTILSTELSLRNGELGPPELDTWARPVAWRIGVACTC